MKQFLQLLCFSFLLCLLMTSCTRQKHYEGDSILNYPDMKIIFKKNIEPYQKEPYTFKLSVIEDGKKDTSFLKAKDVNWKEIEAPFWLANINNKELDKHYTIDVMTDTLTSKITMLLTSLEPKDLTSKMSITARSMDNKIMTVYAETRDAGFFTTKEYKLLFVNEKTIQIQETKKSPFSKVKHKITTLSFLN